ncbi:hypothetical protein [Halorhabdus sp. BNX81]|uniref:DUF7573 domain-containing protein n=1 Tax=Halorhabdus sp. BNX81 TaxID=2980181 RepID=UPI0023DCFE78|nr:hypothetical protein [Halorhabdus sp. BNX81]WEL20308.1 Uncharacterized protein HBNXHr_0229 [Halorhabdus sp. BNX81]
MGDDASLDEFLGDEGESATATESADDEAASGSELPDEAAAQTERAEEPSEESVEPATTTYEFAPGGVECASCGATVDRRWHQHGELVCVACKDW